MTLSSRKKDERKLEIDRIKNRGIQDEEILGQYDAVITAVLLVACSNASNKDLVHVGVLQYVEHPSLSATRKVH